MRGRGLGDPVSPRTSASSSERRVERQSEQRSEPRAASGPAIGAPQARHRREPSCCTSELDAKLAMLIVM
jgi:hypothetical protein